MASITEPAVLTILRDLRYAALRTQAIARDGSKPEHAIGEATA